MSTPTPESPARVLLLRTGDREMVAVAAGQPTTDWRPLAQSALEAVAPHLFTTDGTPAQSASVRHFVMRPTDLKWWDTLNRHGEGGFSYGTLWDDKGISRHVQIKEVPPPVPAGASAPPIDPVAVATAIAVAQIQADIQRLIALVEQVGLDVKTILRFLQLEQEAEILAATETIDEIYAHYRAELRIGDTDWKRLAGLEQVLKKQHRQLIGELGDVANALKFTNVDEAKKAARIDPERVRHLVHLEWYLLCSLYKWSEMMLATKAGRGENSISAAQEVRRLRENYLTDARSALQEIKKADSKMAGRSVWARLFSTDGIALGAKRDSDVARAAGKRRGEVQQLAAVRKRLPAPIAPSSARLVLEAPPAATAAVPPTAG